MKYVQKLRDARNIEKFGVKLSIFESSAESGFVYEETSEGHLEEWFDEKSTYHWFILEGYGTFVIDDESHEVSTNDLVVVPPRKRIHYFGDMKMLLMTTPKFNPNNERHVRIVLPDESPYAKSDQELSA